jgi:hypothetical protein
MQSPEETLELVRKDIAAWRHVRRRGPFPLELRRRAGVVAQFLGEQAVAEALDLDPSLIARWAEQYGAARGHAAYDEPFVDVGRQIASVLGGGARSNASTSDWCVNVSKPCGTTIRVQGPIDAALLEAVVRGAISVR